MIMVWEREVEQIHSILPWVVGRYLNLQQDLRSPAAVVRGEA
jgi:hypothetical protein